MTTDLILLNGLTPSKQSAEQIRAEISKRVEEGDLDPVRVQAAIKFFEKVFNGDDKKNNGLSHVIKPYVINEIEKDKARQEYYGFKVEIKENGVKYDFSNCNHPKLNELYEQQQQLKTQIDDVEKFLKGIPQGGHIMVIDEETGEQVKVFAPVRKSTTSPVFTLK